MSKKTLGSPKDISQLKLVRIPPNRVKRSETNDQGTVMILIYVVANICNIYFYTSPKSKVTVSGTCPSLKRTADKVSRVLIFSDYAHNGTV